MQSKEDNDDNIEQFETFAQVYKLLNSSAAFNPQGR